MEAFDPTKPLEEALGTVGNISSISYVFHGRSIVIAEFEMDTDMDFAALGDEGENRYDQGIPAPKGQVTHEFLRSIST